MKQVNDGYERLKVHVGKEDEGSNIHMFNELWGKIINDITTHPRDLQTIPINRREGVWFHVSVSIGRVTILVDSARTKKPSSKLTQIRLLDKDEFRVMHPIYLRRKKGEEVSKEAAKTTRNQVYIYSIFYHCGWI
ncbi:MAG: hypothetical protein LBD58_09775 [Treponema sp.]|nr:hypothetical protein [Treponema sp.]